jgi:chromosome segregation ATPase
MSFQIPAEKIPALDNRSPHRILADAIADDESTCREQIEKLRAEYQSLAAAVHEIDRRYKVESFPGGNTAGMELPGLRAMEASARGLVVGLRDLIPRLREQKEAERKAALTPTEALQEEIANLKEEFGAARARLARIEARLGLDLPDIPSATSLRYKPSSSAPPMLMATAQRGGGTVSAFFGDDPHAPPSGGGVRRAGRRDG